MSTDKSLSNTTTETIWLSLKDAIAQSSGFQSWQSKQASPNTNDLENDLEKQITTYLKDTLQTLAY